MPKSDIFDAEIVVDLLLVWGSGNNLSRGKFHHVAAITSITPVAQTNVIDLRKHFLIYFLLLTLTCTQMPVLSSFRRFIKYN